MTERKNLKETLITRDNISLQEANELIKEAQAALADYLAWGDGEAAYNVCEEFFGLEPDYLDDLM